MAANTQADNYLVDWRGNAHNYKPVVNYTSIELNFLAKILMRIDSFYDYENGSKVSKS